MVQIDIPVAFGTGSLFAAAVERGLRSERHAYFYYRALAASLLFQAVFVVWLPVYLLVAQFGFQTSHMWWRGDSIVEHRLLLPAFVVAYFASSWAGFAAGARLARQGRAPLARATFAAGFLFFGAWVALQPYRTLTLGSYREWEAGTARWIWTDVPLVVLLAGAALLFFVSLAWIVRALRREAARASPAPARSGRPPAARRTGDRRP
jgi:hypothetical protein